MNWRALLQNNIVRVMAILCLMIGLSDAARLLGVHMGSSSPMLVLGLGGFTLLTLFSLTRLFAAVGLWISASWGGVLVIGVTLIEFGVALAPGAIITLSPATVFFRLVLFIGVLGMAGIRYLHHRKSIHD